MNRQLVIATAALAALSAAACHKTGSNAGKDVTNPEASAPVNTAQDVAAAQVGLASAAANAIDNSTKGYVTGAAMGDMYEIQAGKIAVERSKSPQVKMLAQMIVDDHTMMSKQMMDTLKTANAGADVTLPADLDQRRKGMLDNLKAAGDSDFDLAYLHQQLAGHLEALLLHKAYAARGDNAPLKMLASMATPMIQKHLDEVRKIGGAALNPANGKAASGGPG